MKLLFVHGWAFDSSIWKPLSRNFPGCAFWDLGYFGAPCEPGLVEPFIAVTHSFGTMRVLGSLNPVCRGIVAINGFDRFSESEGFPGVQTRVLDRMISRFAKTPGKVLEEFRTRCGREEAIADFNRERLLEDLISLRDGDCREHAAQSDLPVLSLQGRRDPILPDRMRQAVFAGVGSCKRVTIETGGHLLPIQETATCAEAITAFMKQLS